jgi:hypothetical protein
VGFMKHRTDDLLPAERVGPTGSLRRSERCPDDGPTLTADRVSFTKH